MKKVVKKPAQKVTKKSPFKAQVKAALKFAEAKAALINTAQVTLDYLERLKYADLLYSARPADHEAMIHYVAYPNDGDEYREYRIMCRRVSLRASREHVEGEAGSQPGLRHRTLRVRNDGKMNTPRRLRAG